MGAASLTGSRPLPVTLLARKDHGLRFTPGCDKLKDHSTTRQPVRDPPRQHQLAGFDAQASYLPTKPMSISLTHLHRSYAPRSLHTVSTSLPVSMAGDGDKRPRARLFHLTQEEHQILYDIAYRWLHIGFGARPSERQLYTEFRAALPDTRRTSRQVDASFTRLYVGSGPRGGRPIILVSVQRAYAWRPAPSTLMLTSTLPHRRTLPSRVPHRRAAAAQGTRVGPSSQRSPGR